MKNRGVGFIFTLIACVLALVGVITYTQVMHTTPGVYVALIIAIVLVVLAIVLNKKALNTWLPVFVAALMGFAVGYSFLPMVNQIAYVVSGLDQINTLYSFITFAAIAGVGMILAIVSGFLRQTKDE